MSLVIWKAERKGMHVRGTRCSSHPEGRNDCRGRSSALCRTTATLRITSPGHTNSPAPRLAHHRHRPKDAPSQDSKHQAPPSHTSVSSVLADLSMTPVAPCRGLPFAATGLPELQPRAPPSSPSLPFTLAHAQRRVTVAERGQTRPLKPAQRSPGSS